MYCSADRQKFTDISDESTVSIFILEEEQTSKKLPGSRAA
jgi:hypothetical protein